MAEKNDAERIQEIFEELEDIQHKLKRLENHKTHLENRRQDLEKYESLSEEEHVKIVKLLDQYKSIMEQIKLMEGRLIRNNPSLRIIQTYEKEMPEIIKEMRQTETKQRHAQSDILYLDEEKNHLYTYREELITGYRVLKIGAIILTIILGIVCVVIFTMAQSLEKDIFIPTSIVSIATLFFVFGILAFKRRIEHELEKNEYMQQRAVKLLNKAKIQYFHFTNYLEYEYNKLGVISSEQLQGHYNRYMKNKSNDIHYRGLNNQLIEIEQRVFDILYEKGIQRDIFVNIDEWAEIQKSSVMLKNAESENKNIDRQLEALHTYEQELYQEAFAISNSNPELVQLVEVLLGKYLDRADQESLDKISEHE